MDEYEKEMKSVGDSIGESVLTTSQSSDNSDYEGLDGFWPNVASDLKALYASVSSTAGGVVGFLQTSALSVAAEIAELERQEGASVDKLRLPWEVDDYDDEGRGATVEDDELRSKILLVSTEASNFLGPHTEVEDFLLDESRICLIRDLLDFDENLAKTHARLSGRTAIAEALFWRNYFYHCDTVRKEYLHATKDISTILSADDSSYVCVDGYGLNRPPSRPPSAPSSLNMLSRSADDLVILGNPEDIPKSPVQSSTSFCRY